MLPNGTQVMVDRGVRRVLDARGTVTYELHGNGWRFVAGHTIRIEISQDEGQFYKPSVQPSTTTVHGVRLRIPVREPQRDNFRNAARFCKAQRAFLGEQRVRRPLRHEPEPEERVRQVRLIELN